MELPNETPSWQIMNITGRVTVVMDLDQLQQGSSKSEPVTAAAGNVSGTATPKKQSSLVIQNSVDWNRKETLINDVYPPRYLASPQITVINHDDVSASSSYHHPHLTKQGSTIHVHTPECANHAHQPSDSRSGSPNNSTSECDFHCCALHKEGRKIAVHKTCPIQDSLLTSPKHHPSFMSDGSRRAAGVHKRHVRFFDVEGGHRHAPTNHESSEFETENTVIEDEAVTTEKLLLLIDQLSIDQKRHLTIKDIGIILEILSSEILDVETLDRESESDDCSNWTIKATIRGDVLRELGVIYNGNYYAISEHPGYKEESEDTREDVEEEEEENDRL